MSKYYKKCFMVCKNIFDENRDIILLSYKKFSVTYLSVLKIKNKNFITNVKINYSLIKRKFLSNLFLLSRNILLAKKIEKRKKEKGVLSYSQPSIRINQTIFCMNMKIS